MTQMFLMMEKIDRPSPSFSIGHVTESILVTVVCSSMEKLAREAFVGVLADLKVPTAYTPCNREAHWRASQRREPVATSSVGRRRLDRNSGHSEQHGEAVTRQELRVGGATRGGNNLT